MRDIADGMYLSAYFRKTLIDAMSDFRPSRRLLFDQPEATSYLQSPDRSSYLLIAQHESDHVEDLVLVLARSGVVMLRQNSLNFLDSSED
ncbi:MAG TPA: hypothetical protein VMU69_11890 [Bradyrhizobium sp.]|nr:hypothetical protein [Bradyrhizobium sp.]